jgi:hypothetical protein
MSGRILVCIDSEYFQDILFWQQGSRKLETLVESYEMRLRGVGLNRQQE